MYFMLAKWKVNKRRPREGFWCNGDTWITTSYMYFNPDSISCVSKKPNKDHF